MECQRASTFSFFFNFFHSPDAFFLFVHLQWHYRRLEEVVIVKPMRTMKKMQFKSALLGALLYAEVDQNCPHIKILL